MKSANIALIAISTFIVWKVFQYKLLVSPSTFAYFVFAPYAYRLWDASIIHFWAPDRALTLSWAVSMLAVEAIHSFDTGHLALFLFPLAIYCPMNAPMYPLLLLLTRYASSPWAAALLMPLALVKEVALWVGVGIMLYRRWPQWRAPVAGAIPAGMLYLAVRWLIGPAQQINTSPFVTVAFWPALLLAEPAYLLIAVITVALLGGLCMHRWSVRLLIWNFLPLLVFALPWEPQLWAPMGMSVAAIEEGIG